MIDFKVINECKFCGVDNLYDLKRIEELFLKRYYFFKTILFQLNGIHRIS